MKSVLRHKFNAVRCEADNIKFASKRECRRYLELKTLREKGEVVRFLRQTAFHLPGNTKYICDFTVFWTGGEITFEDVKGMRTAVYIAKKKMVEDLYDPIKITEI